MTTSRRADGSAGDADYGTIGVDYARYRRPEPGIAARIRDAIGDAHTLLNVGAGAGSYEPTDLEVTAVEPSATMRAQRPPHLTPAVDAVAEHLPFDDDSFDAAMATFTVHQWPRLEAGLAEVRRVTRGPIAVLTADPARLTRFWLNEYAPEVLTAEAGRYPTMERLVDALGGPARASVQSIPIPLECTDGFNEAYYGRPEALLDPGARRANSAWSFVGEDVDGRFVERLTNDLRDGSWDARHGALRSSPEFEGSLVLVVGRP